jgi:hypothetical protein
MIYKEDSITTIQGDTWRTALNKLYAKLATKFTGNNDIILLGIQVGNVYFINSTMSADNTIKGQYDCIRNGGDSTGVLFVNMTLKSTGSEYVYGGISSSKSISFAYNSSKTIQGIGTYYIYYLEKKHV